MCMNEMTQSHLIQSLFLPTAVYTALRQMTLHHCISRKLSLVMGIRTLFSAFSKSPHCHFSVFQFSQTLTGLIRTAVTSRTHPPAGFPGMAREAQAKWLRLKQGKSPGTECSSPAFLSSQCPGYSPAWGKPGDIPQVYSRVCVGGEHERPSCAPGELGQILSKSEESRGPQAISLGLCWFMICQSFIKCELC